MVSWMLLRNASFLVVLVIIVTILVAMGTTTSNKNESPKYILVEEHHHVVSHLVEFAKEGILKSHTDRTLVEGEVNPNGAIVIHMDSHADMALTVGLNHLPAERLRTNLPITETEAFQLIEHSLINDFLLLLGYMGIAEHIVWVEPPWSIILNDAHHTTVDISIGVVAPDEINGEGGATYGSIRNSKSTTFQKEISEEAMNCLIAAMDDWDEPVDIIPHEELLQHCSNENGKVCHIRTVRFTTLPYEGTTVETINQLLDFEDDDKDIILDIDLDGFTSTSPGALSLGQTVFASHGGVEHDDENDVLTRIYHTVHGDRMCDYDAFYWKRFTEMSSRKTNGDETDDDDDEVCQSYDWSYVHGESFQPSTDDDADPLAFKIVSDRARGLVERLDFHWKMDDNAVTALGEVFEYYLSSIDDAPFDNDAKFIEMMDNFLQQPFYVPDQETIRPVIDYHFDVIFQGIFGDSGSSSGSSLRRVPKVVNIVRSPFYTPDHHLDFIECEVFDRILDLFGGHERESSSSASLSPPSEQQLYHSDEVDPDRTNCLNRMFPSPEQRFSIGENPHIDRDEWTNTYNAFSSFYEDRDYTEL